MSDLIQQLLRSRLDWKEVSDNPYLFEGVFQSQKVRLRLNNFPAEPICTLLVDGEEQHLEEFPSTWTLPGHRLGKELNKPEQTVHKPSVFIYGLIGYLIASALGIPAVVVLSIRAGDYHEQAAFQILVCIGAMGALIGFEIAARRLRAFGGGGMVAEWKRFWGSLPFYSLIAIVLGGAAAITLLGSLVAIAVMEPPTPK